LVINKPIDYLCKIITIQWDWALSIQAFQEEKMTTVLQKSLPILLAFLLVLIVLVTLGKQPNQPGSRVPSR